MLQNVLTLFTQTFEFLHSRSFCTFYIIILIIQTKLFSDLYLYLFKFLDTSKIVLSVFYSVSWKIEFIKFSFSKNTFFSTKIFLFTIIFGINIKLYILIVRYTRSDV